MFFSYVLDKISCVSICELSSQCLGGCLTGSSRRRVRAGMRASLMCGMFYNHQPSASRLFGAVVPRFTFSSDFTSPLQRDTTGHRLFSAWREGGKSEIGWVGGCSLQSPIIAQAAWHSLPPPLAAPLPTWLLQVLPVGCEGCFCYVGCLWGIWAGRAEMFMQKLLNFFSQNVPEVYLHWVTSLLVLDSKIK